MTYDEMVAGAARRYPDSDAEYTPYLPGMDAAALDRLSSEIDPDGMIDGWVSYRVHFTVGPLPEGGPRLRNVSAEGSVA